MQMRSLASGGWALCDCGEGAQLAAQRAGLSLSRLDAVLITHLHGDHFNGLPGLLGTLGLEGRERPLLVAGPRGLRGLVALFRRPGIDAQADRDARGFRAGDYPVDCARVCGMIVLAKKSGGAGEIVGPYRHGVDPRHCEKFVERAERRHILDLRHNEYRLVGDGDVLVEIAVIVRGAARTEATR